MTPVWTCWVVVVFWVLFFFLLFFFFNCPGPASVRCRVPLTQSSRQCGTAGACAAESSTFPCWIRSDMCLLFLPLSLFSQDARLCACQCQRDACVKCRCVRSRSLPLSLSLSDVHAPVGGSKRTFRCFPQERQNHDGDGEKMPPGGSEMSSNLPSHFVSSAKTKNQKALKKT